MNSRRNANDHESGIALPLAIIMVLLVSVIGAGLLTFVVSDLDSAAQTQRGQQAFGIADAGVAAAQEEIRSNPDPSWNEKEVIVPGANDSTYVSIEKEGTTYVVTSTGKVGEDSSRKVVANFTREPTQRTHGSEVIPQTIFVHKTSEFDRFSLDGSTPDANGNASGLRMHSGGTVDIEFTDFIFRDASLYSGGDIKLPGPGSLVSACVSAPSIITLGIRLLPDSRGIVSSGSDPDGNWSNTYNATARKVTSPGMGAVGRIGYRDTSLNCKPLGWGSRFFDKDTRSSGLVGDILEGILGTLLGSNRLNAKFVNIPSSPQLNREITYPFDETYLTATNPTSGKTGLRRLADDLKSASIAQTKSHTISQNSSFIGMTQGNFIEVKNGKSEVTVCDVSNPGCGDGLNVVWPTVPANTPPEQWPVVYIKFGDDGSNNKVSWRVQSQPQFSGSDPAARCSYARTSTPNSVRRGILVVENGKIDLPESAAPLDGGMVTIGEPNSHNRDISGSAGDLCIRGSVIADGKLERQNYTGFSALPEDQYRFLPGFNTPPESGFNVPRQNWRESYE